MILLFYFFSYNCSQICHCLLCWARTVHKTTKLHKDEPLLHGNICYHVSCKSLFPFIIPDTGYLCVWGFFADWYLFWNGHNVSLWWRQWELQCCCGAISSISWRDTSVCCSIWSIGQRKGDFSRWVRLEFSMQSGAHKFIIYRLKRKSMDCYSCYL